MKGRPVINRNILHTMQPIKQADLAMFSLAYEAFQKNSDVASLLPCTVVVRDMSKGKVSIEITKPTAMMKMLGDGDLVNLAKDVDIQLELALETIN